MVVGLTVDADRALGPLAWRPKPGVTLVSYLSLVIRLFLGISFFCFAPRCESCIGDTKLQLWSGPGTFLAFRVDI